MDVLQLIWIETFKLTDFVVVNGKQECSFVLKGLKPSSTAGNEGNSFVYRLHSEMLKHIQLDVKDHYNAYDNEDSVIIYQEAVLQQILLPIWQFKSLFTWIVNDFARFII